MDEDCLVCGEPAIEGRMVSYRVFGVDGPAHIECLSPEVGLALADTVSFTPRFADGSRLFQKTIRLQRALLLYKGLMVTAMAKYGGIFGPLSCPDRPADEVENALARYQERGELPEGWPYTAPEESCWPW